MESVQKGKCQKVTYSVFNMKELLVSNGISSNSPGRGELHGYAFLGLRSIIFGISLIRQLDTLGRLP